MPEYPVRTPAVSARVHLHRQLQGMNYHACLRTCIVTSTAWDANDKLPHTTDHRPQEARTDHGCDSVFHHAVDGGLVGGLQARVLCVRIRTIRHLLIRRSANPVINRMGVLNLFLLQMRDAFCIQHLERWCWDEKHISNLHCWRLFEKPKPCDGIRYDV